MNLIPSRRTVVLTPVKISDISPRSTFQIEAVTTKGQPEIGEVIAVGKPDKKGLPIEGLKPKDVVAYRRYGEAKFFLEGKEYLFISFDDILGLIKGGKRV